MAQTRPTSNCGMAELHGLGSPTREILSQAYRCGQALIVFSDNAYNHNGARLIETIKTYGLGTVVKTPQVRSTHTGNPIFACGWAVDRTRLNRYLQGKLTPVLQGKRARKPARKVAGKTRARRVSR